MWVAAAIALLAIVILFFARRQKQGTDQSPAGDDQPAADVVDVPEESPPAPVGPSPYLPAPEGEADDLRRIKGIGPKLAARLSELGVYHYRQIADWTPQQLAAIDQELGQFSGRPERDQWQSQARLLADGDIKAYEKLHGKLGG